MKGRDVSKGCATLLIAWVLAAGPAAARGGLAVAGLDRARLLPPAGARVSGYENAGYRLWWEGDEVHVEVDVSPLESETPFELPRPAGGRLDRLARGLTAGAATHYDAISRVLGWVAAQIEYDLDRSQPQTAEAVLDRRSGYCTGVARLSVALLRAAGIQAREVAGYVVGTGGGGEPSGFHRWIESYLPDRGWVFSDPLLTHHYVPATYLRLASEQLEPTRGTEGLLLERRDEVATVDLYPAAAPGVTGRRNSDHQLAAALRVSFEDRSTGTAVLTGDSQRWTHVLIDGATTFVGLDPGSYHLRLLLPGRVVFESMVELPDRIRKTIVVRSPELSRAATSRGTSRGTSPAPGRARRRGDRVVDASGARRQEIREQRFLRLRNKERV